MHSRIIEIRNGKKFSAEEIEDGVMNADEMFDRYQNEWLDYIDGLTEHDREEDLDWFVSRLDGVFTREGDELTLSQEDYDAFIEKYVEKLRDAVSEITPKDFYPEQQFSLRRLACLESDFCDFRVYNEDIDDVVPFVDWLMSTSVYHEKDGDGRKFYIGKVWDYKS